MRKHKRTHFFNPKTGTVCPLQSADQLEAAAVNVLESALFPLVESALRRLVSAQTHEGRSIGVLFDEVSDVKQVSYVVCVGDAQRLARGDRAGSHQLSGVVHPIYLERAFAALASIALRLGVGLHVFVLRYGQSIMQVGEVDSRGNFRLEYREDEPVWSIGSASPIQVNVRGDMSSDGKVEIKAIDLASFLEKGAGFPKNLLMNQDEFNMTIGRTSSGS